MCLGQSLNVVHSTYVLLLCDGSRMVHCHIVIITGNGLISFTNWLLNNWEMVTAIIS